MIDPREIPVLRPALDNFSSARNRNPGGGANGSMKLAIFSSANGIESMTAAPATLSKSVRTSMSLKTKVDLVITETGLA